MNVLIATIEQEIYRGRACMVIAPAVEGELSIMPGHAPLLAILRPGEVRIDCLGGNDSPTLDIVVSGGFLEVQPDAVIILADTVVRDEDMGAAQAELAVEQARKMLQSSDKEKAGKAWLDLELAVAKLRVMRRKSKHSLMKP